MIIEAYKPGTPSWVDLMAPDQDAAIAFYNTLFGWDALRSGPEMGDYAMCMKSDQPVAGIGVLAHDAGFPSAWTTYISTDDVDATVAAATENGGQVVAPVMTVEGEGQKPGRMAIIADPTGAVFGVWEPHDHKGSGLANEPGSFGWNELHSRDPEVSRAFLGAVFGYEWKKMDRAPMDYYLAQVDGRDVFGAMEIPQGMPPETPSNWMTYFVVTDTDSAVATVVANGGTALSEPMDTPFGRMAVVSDPGGAPFCVIQPAPMADPEAELDSRTDERRDIRG
jgi:uncharacterized protein